MAESSSDEEFVEIASFDTEKGEVSSYVQMSFFENDPLFCACFCDKTIDGGHY